MKSDSLFTREKNVPEIIKMGDAKSLPYDIWAYIFKNLDLSTVFHTSSLVSTQWYEMSRKAWAQIQVANSILWQVVASSQTIESLLVEYGKKVFPSPLWEQENINSETVKNWLKMNTINLKSDMAATQEQLLDLLNKAHTWVKARSLIQTENGWQLQLRNNNDLSIKDVIQVISKTLKLERILIVSIFCGLRSFYNFSLETMTNLYWDHFDTRILTTLCLRYEPLLLSKLTKKSIEIQEQLGFSNQEIVSQNEKWFSQKITDWLFHLPEGVIVDITKFSKSSPDSSPDSIVTLLTHPLLSSKLSDGTPRLSDETLKAFILIFVTCDLFHSIPDVEKTIKTLFDSIHFRNRLENYPKIGKLLVQLVQEHNQKSLDVESLFFVLATLKDPSLQNKVSEEELLYIISHLGIIFHFHLINTILANTALHQRIIQSKNLKSMMRQRRVAVTSTSLDSNLNRIKNNIGRIIIHLNNHSHQLETYAYRYLDTYKGQVYFKRSIVLNALRDNLIKKVKDHYENEIFFNEDDTCSDYYDRMEILLYKNLQNQIKQHINDHPILCFHTGYKQVIYDILAVFSWFLMPPYAIYAMATKHTFFYFKATTNTEKGLNNINKELEILAME